MYAVRPQWPPVRAFWCKNLRLVWSGSSRVGAVGPPHFCVTGLFFFRASSDRLAARREASAGQSSHGGVRRSPASLISVRPKECRGGDASPPRSIGRACRWGEGEMPLDP